MALFKGFTIEEHEDLIDVIRKYQKYVYLLIVIIISIQLFLSIAVPKMKKYSQKRTLLSEFSETYEMKRDKAVGKVSLDDELDKYRALIVESEGMFFSDQEVSEFSITQIPRLAEGYGNIVQGISYASPYALDEKVQISPIALNFTGSYYGVVSFFNKLETMKKVIQIESFTLNRISVEPVTLGIRMKFNIYTMKK